MKEKHGDLMADNDYAIEEALEATHNVKRGEMIAAELSALQEVGKKMKPAFIRQWARERIAERKVGEIQPRSFVAAERRFGKLAGKLLRKGDKVGAARAKLQQLLNFHMAREAYKIRDEVESGRKFMDKFNRKKKKWATIDPDFIDKIRDILDLYQLGSRLTDKKRAKFITAALDEWADAKVKNEEAVFEIPAAILKADGSTHFRDLTLEESRGLVDTIKLLHAQGRQSKTIEIDGENRDLNEVAGEISAEMDDREQTARMFRSVDGEADLDPARSFLSTVKNSLKKVEFMLDEIGPAARKYIFQVIADAEAARNDLTKKGVEAILAAVDAIPKDIRKKSNDRIRVPLLGRSFRRSEIIMMALNTGTESNYWKMIEGSKHYIASNAKSWTEEGVDEALSHLSAEEWV